MYIIEECYVDEESDKPSERVGRSSSPTLTDKTTLTIYTYNLYVGFDLLVTTDVYETMYTYSPHTRKQQSNVC